MFRLRAAGYSSPCVNAGAFKPGDVKGAVLLNAHARVTRQSCLQELLKLVERALAVEEAAHVVRVEREAQGCAYPAQQGQFAMRADIDERGKLVAEGVKNGIAASRQDGQTRRVIDVFWRTKQQAMQSPGLDVRGDSRLLDAWRLYMKLHRGIYPS